jgi:parallel beta-helix repeat protein
MLDNYWLTAAVYVAGSNNTIQGNTVRKSGYLGISFAKGNNILVKNNWVDSTAFVLDEGGAIYTYRGSDATVYSNRSIDGNIITNVIGALGGKTSGSGAAAGIQMDGNSQGVSITNNSIANVSMYGILLFNAHEITIWNNTVYNCASGTLGMVHDAGWNYIRNVAIKSNKFVMATPNNSLGNWVYQTAENDLLQFGSADSNVVATPMNDVNAFFTFDGSTYSHRTVTQWQSFSGMDKHSKASPKTVTSLSSLRFEYNATGSSKTISLGKAYIDIKGASFPSSITLAPYTSAVLIESGSGAQSVANTTEIVDEINLIEKPSLTIYPNPVRDNFILQLNNSHMGKMDVQLMNQAGAIVRSYLFNKDQIVNQITVPAHDLPTGVYFIHVQIGTWSDKRKIVKL